MTVRHKPDQNIWLLSNLPLIHHHPKCESKDVIRASICDVPVDVRVLQVERLAGVIPQDEREHRVLHEVIEGAPGMLVEMREVLEVGDLPRTPQLSERRDVAVLQQVGQVGGQDVVVDIVTELGWKRKREP